MISVPKTLPNFHNPFSLHEKFNNEDELAFSPLSLSDDYSLLEAEALQAARWLTETVLPWSGTVRNLIVLIKIM